MIHNFLVFDYLTMLCLSFSPFTALLMGDGLYSLCKVMTASLRAFCTARQQHSMQARAPFDSDSATAESADYHGMVARAAAALQQEQQQQPVSEGLWSSVCCAVQRVSNGVLDAVAGERGRRWFGAWLFVLCDACKF